MINLHQILDRMNPDQKINYDTIMQKMVRDWETKEQRPKILLHACCAPCSTYTLEYLTQYADVTIYYANSNIHPRDEYRRREYVIQKFITKFNETTHNKVKFIAAPYAPQDYLRAVRGLENEPEGGARCQACFTYRLETVAQKALELGGYDYFGSSLTISPHKNSQVINKVGIDIQELYDLKYLPSDFKKNGGYQRSVQMCKEYDIYRQCYCGCVFAAKAQGVNLSEIRKEAKTFMEGKDAVTEFASIRINIGTD